MRPYQKPVPSPAKRSVSEVRGWVRSQFGQREITMRGECMAPRKTDNRWSFDLVSVSPSGIEFLSCVVWDEMAPRIDAHLRGNGSSLEQAMSEGMLLTLTGTLWLNSEGTVGVRVTAIESDFARRGVLHLEDKKAIASLRAAGVPKSRLSNAFTHDNPENAFKYLDCKPDRVMVVGPANAQGIGDLKSRLSNSRRISPEVFYRPISWAASGSIGIFQAHLQEAQDLGLDLVVLAQGGGHWRWLRSYQRAELALAIQKSPVPVATAVGHDSDVSVADRAATLSFATPTAAAEAISNELAFHRRQQRRDAHQSAERERRASEQLARAADRSALESNIAVLKAKYTDARVAAGAAQRRESEALAGLYNAFTVHTKDLLETAEERVRLISRVSSAAILVVAAVLLVLSEEVMALLQSGSTAPQGWPYFVAIAATAIGLFVWQRRARRNIGLPSASAMKRPPGDVDSWRFAVKKVRTVRRLRQLRRHAPI